MRTFKRLLLPGCLLPGLVYAELIGIGESHEGYYQLDTTTIEGPGTTFATAWAVIVPAPNSEPRKYGANIMLVMYAMDCKSKTIRTMAWKAKNAQDQIIGQGVHGKETQRAPARGSIDERLYTRVCTWKKR